jgi:hypothetical protein
MTLKSMGQHFVTVLTLVIVLGNLLYPDMVYAKNAYYGGGWGGGYTTTYYNNRKRIKKGPIGPGPFDQAEKQMKKMSLPQRNDVSDAGSQTQDGNVPAAPTAKTLSDIRANKDRLTAMHAELAAHHQNLLQELAEYQGSAQTTVSYGSRDIAREEAVRLTELAIKRTEPELSSIAQRILALQSEIEEISATVSDKRNA